jgi:glycosyl transferase, family 25
MNQTTYVINLAHRADRRDAMQRELGRVGWTAEFFPAISPTDSDGFPSVGARGCFLSHLGVLKEAAKSGARRLVVLEDDLNFVSDFSHLWAALLKELEGRDWAFLYPGHILDDLPNGLSRLSPSMGVMCSHFIMINGRALPTLIEGLEAILSRPPGHPMGGPMHVDGAYSTIRAQHPELVTYACSPVLGYQRSSRSDIASAHWYDRAPGLSSAASYARRVKSNLIRIWN